MNRGAILLAFLLAVLLLPHNARAQSNSSGTSGQPSDVTEEENPNDKLVKSYRFRNSTLEWSQSMSALTLDRSAELTYNPTYSWLFRLTPRFYITKQLYTRVKVGLAVEWTNSDDTTAYHEPLWEDMWWDFVYGNLYKEKVTGIALSPSLRLILPTSKSSQARSLYLGLQPGFSLRRSFKLPRKMGIDLGYAFSYTKSLNKYSTVQYDAPTIITCEGSGGLCDRFSHSGARNPSHTFMNTFLVDWSITKKLKFGAMVALVNALVYDITPGSVTVAGGTVVNVPADPDTNVWHRAAMTYSFELGYEVHPAISVGLASFTYNPQLTDNSTYRAPFFNRYTELSLTTTINLDRIVAGIHRKVKPSALMASAN